MAIDVESIVDQKIGIVNELITEALAASSAALDNLQEIENQTPGFIGFNPEPYTPTPITIDATAPTAPDLDSQIDGLVQSDIEDVQIADISLNVQPLPDEILNWIPTPVEYVEGIYESTLLDALKAKLESDVTSGSIGLTDSVEQDIIDRNSERDAQIWRDARDKVVAQWATSGFVLPDNVLQAAIQELVVKEANATTDRSRDIRIESFKMATENTRFVIQQGIVLESQLMNHFNQTAERAIRFVLASAETGMKIYLGLVEAYKVQNEVALMDMQTQTAIERLKIEQLQAKLLKYKTDADVAVTKIKALIDKYQVDVSAYSAELGKAEALARVTVSQQAMVAQHYLGAMNVGMEAAKTNLSNFTAVTNIKTGAATAMGNIYANYLAAAINSLNAVIQAAATETRSGSLT